jgi:hypothetical protein
MQTDDVVRPVPGFIGSMWENPRKYNVQRAGIWNERLYCLDKAPDSASVCIYDRFVDTLGKETWFALLWRHVVAPCRISHRRIEAYGVTDRKTVRDQQTRCWARPWHVDHQGRRVEKSLNSFVKFPFLHRLSLLCFSTDVDRHISTVITSCVSLRVSVCCVR